MRNASNKLQLAFRVSMLASALLLGTLGSGLTGCAGNTGNLAAVRPVAITHDDFALADANHDGKLSRLEADNYLAFVVFTSSDADADGR